MSIDVSEFCVMFAEAAEQPDGSITVATIFREIDGWDSVTLLGVLAAIDDRYGASLSASDIESVSSVGEVAELVSTRASR